MNRQQEALALAEGLMTNIELTQTSTAKHVLKGMRLARLMRDDVAQQWLGFEIDGIPSTPEGLKWMTYARRWTDVAEQKGYWAPAAELEAVRIAGETALAAQAGNVSLSGESITIAMRERSQLMSSYAASAAAMSKVLASIDAQIYRYAGDVHAELQFSEIQASLFEDSRTAVDATFATMAGAALKKVDSISERLAANDAEAVSQAMSTCRRLIDAVADHVFPASDDPYDLNGQTLNVKQNAVLNRINAFVHTRGVHGGRADRLRRGMADIYGRVSTGVHSDVDGHEARYLFLTTYVLLGEVLTLGTPPTS
jgi:hypothetical protein